MAVRRPRYTFLKDESALQLKAALVMAGSSFACLIVLVLFAYSKTGTAGAAAGAVGLSAMLVAWYAFSVSLRELVRRPVGIRLAVISTGCTGLLSIIWLALFLSGVKQL